jgi:hypothetical protein
LYLRRFRFDHHEGICFPVTAICQATIDFRLTSPDFKAAGMALIELTRGFFAVVDEDDRADLSRFS